jgi:NADH:ubiquinone reductase (H+-translocating)
MSAEASRKSQEFLEDFGVKIWLNRRVQSYDGYTVLLDTGEKLISRTVLWAAGVTGAPIAGLRPESLLKGNRFQVDAFNRVAGYEHIFAIGDIAAMVTEDNPQGHPMMAQPAIQQGKLLGRNLALLLQQQAPVPFRYHDQGAMATIGRNHAVADLRILNKEYRSQGLVAWFIWMFIHLISIIGFRNRLMVLFNWLWSYFSFDKGIRLILGWKKENVPEESLTEKALT